jgi:hypothetical protein
MATPPDFSVGQVLTAANMNAVGLWLVKSQTISGTATQVNDCFTSDYQSYRLVFSNLTSSSVDFITARLVAGTTPNTANDYYSSYFQVGTNGAYSGNGNSAASFWNTPIVGFTTPSGGVLDIYNPQSATATSFNANGVDTRTDGAPHRSGGGFHNSATSFQGIWLSTVNGGLTMGGTVRVYGLRN